jgi:acetyl esterase
VLDAETRRGSNEATAKLIGVEKPSQGLTQQNVSIDVDGVKIPIRIYIPDGDGPFPAMLNLHGGGFFAGDHFAFDALPMQLAVRAKVVVFSVDYRLAPQSTYPAAVDDCFAALQWVAANATTYRADPLRIGVMGQSAGGNLAAVVALKARDQGGPKITFQYLEVPVVDLSNDRDWPSKEEAGDRYFLKVSMMPTMADAYVPHVEDRKTAYISPLRASDHHNLPAALIVVAQFDPLRDQGIAYAQVLKSANVPVQLEIAPGVLHGFIGTPDRALQNLALVQTAMARAFSR